MNSSKPFDILNSNLSDIFYRNIGSSSVLDLIYLCCFVPIGFVGMLLNLYSCLVFIRIRDNQRRLYDFMVANAVVGSLLCSLIVFEFMTFSPRYVDWLAAFSLTSRVFRCIVFNFIGSTLFFITSVIDLFLLLDRLAVFDVKYKKLLVFSPPVTCSIIVFSCFVINLPFFFYQQTHSDDDFQYELKNLAANSSYVFCYRDQFMSSTYGLIIYSFVILIKDVLTLCIQIYECTMLFIHFRRFLSSKIARVQSSSSGHDFERAKKRKITFMIIYFSSFSVIMHFSMIYLNSLYLIQLVFSDTALIPVMILSIKPLSNFVIFFAFDNNFRSSIISSKFCQIRK